MSLTDVARCQEGATLYPFLVLPDYKGSVAARPSSIMTDRPWRTTAEQAQTTGMKCDDCDTKILLARNEHKMLQAKCQCTTEPVRVDSALPSGWR